MIAVFHHRYSTDGGFTWKPYVFSPDRAILARDVVTQPGERLPIFLIYGNGHRNRAWTAFYINMTNVMGKQPFRLFLCIALRIPTAHDFRISACP